MSIRVNSEKRVVSEAPEGNTSPKMKQKERRKGPRRGGGDGRYLFEDTDRQTVTTGRAVLDDQSGSRTLERKRAERNRKRATGRETLTGKKASVKEKRPQAQLDAFSRYDDSSRQQQTARTTTRTTTMTRTKDTRRITRRVETGRETKQRALYWYVSREGGTTEPLSHSINPFRFILLLYSLSTLPTLLPANPGTHCPSTSNAAFEMPGASSQPLRTPGPPPRSRPLLQWSAVAWVSEATFPHPSHVLMEPMLFAAAAAALPLI